MEPEQLVLTLHKMDGHPVVTIQLGSEAGELGPILVSDEESAMVVACVSQIVGRYITSMEQK